MKQDEINKTSEEIKVKMQQMQTKYDDQMKKMSSISLIISQQVTIQNESIGRCYISLKPVSNERAQKNESPLDVSLEL